MQTLKSLVVAALLASLIGCSHKSVSVNGTNVDTDDNNKSVTVTSKDGTVAVGKNAVDLTKIGVPIYPGANQGENGMSLTGSGPNGNAQMASLTSTDSFDKVYAWYASQLPKDAEKMKTSAAGNSTAEFIMGGANAGDTQTVVTLSGTDAKTTILIVKGVKQ